MAMAPRPAAFLKASLVPFTLAMGLLSGSGAARANDGLITQFCLAAFHAAMNTAGETPPDGMGTFTCDCFVNEVKAGAAIEAAQASCKTKAAARYKL